MPIKNFQQYEPKSVSDIVFSDSNSKLRIMDIVNGNRPFPVATKNGILLYGLPGTGKSALAKLLPDAIEKNKSGFPACERYLRISDGNNGSSLIQSMQAQANLIPISPDFHYFVLDEVDNLRGPSMLSLKSLMNSSNTIFIMTTNYFDDVEQGVKDRCHCIPFDAAQASDWLPLARQIMNDHELFSISDKALIAVINTCNGSARQILDALIDIILASNRNAALSLPSLSSNLS